MKNVLIAASLVLFGFAGYKLLQMKSKKELKDADKKLLDNSDKKAKTLAKKIAIVEIEQPANNMAQLWPNGTIQCYENAGETQNASLYHFVNPN
ncbi:MAG: hypothetical protein FGM31_05345 [Candidatus Methylopumilus sp.]|nr:hypothetical protein [Candidatus Methylopumilus sp.]